MDRNRSPRENTEPLVAHLADSALNVRGDAARRRFAWALICRAFLWRQLERRTAADSPPDGACRPGRRKEGGLYRRVLLPLLDEHSPAPGGVDSRRLRIRHRYASLAGAVFDQPLSAFSNAELKDEAAESLLERIRACWSVSTSTTELNLLEPMLSRVIDRKRLGAFYTPDDVTEYMASRTLLPLLLRRAAEKRPEVASIWKQLLRESPDEYYPSDSSPANRDIQTVGKLITQTVDLRRLTQDTIASGGELVRRAVLDVLSGDVDSRPLSVLDPTCGAGAFLVAALRVLSPVYEACGLTGEEAVATVIARNVHGVDLAPEAVETCRLRLVLERLLRQSDDADPKHVPDVRTKIRCGNALLGDVLEHRPLPNGNGRKTSEHRPFDWQTEFPRVLQCGGFDAVIGNPPYVEYTRDRVAYPLDGEWRTRGCDNLHALVSERAAELLEPRGAFGFIVPAASVCTPRMRPLVELWQERFGGLWISMYDERPGKLFPVVDQQLAIVLGHDAGPCREQFITPMRHWSARPVDERRELFTSLPYQALDPELRVAGVIPKVGWKLELGMLEKLRRISPLSWRADNEEKDAEPVYYKNAGGRYWRLVKTFPTRYRSDRGAKCTSTEIALPVRATLAPLVVCCLSSSLFYWYWRVVSNCRHLTERELSDFPLPRSLASPESSGQFAELCSRYERRLKQTRIRKTTNSVRNGRIVQDEFRVASAKPILDEIDAALAPHYGLSDEELDFVINYDLTYRLARRRSRTTVRPTPATSPP